MLDLSSQYTKKLIYCLDLNDHKVYASTGYNHQIP